MRYFVRVNQNRLEVRTAGDERIVAVYDLGQYRAAVAAVRSANKAA